MGNFEKLSVLVIGVIIVMILVVALYTWTDDPGGEEAATTGPDTHMGTALPTNLTSEVPTDATTPPTEANPWEDYVPARPAPVEPLDRPSTDEPAAEDTPEAEDAPEVEETVARQVTVKEGDTLGGISLAAYGTTKYWQEIARKNDVDPMKLRPGMTLILPDIETASAPPNKPGDTVAAVGAPKPGSSYTVRNGDTIQKISQAAYRTIERWTDIWFANMERLPNPERLPVGMTLTIPN